MSFFGIFQFQYLWKITVDIHHVVYDKEGNREKMSKRKTYLAIQWFRVGITVQTLLFF